MSSSRAARCFRGRAMVYFFILISIAGVFLLYKMEERNIEYSKNEQSKCFKEQASLFRRLREESDAKEKALYTVNIAKKSLANLTEIYIKEKSQSKMLMEKVQEELETLKLECSKYEKQAQEEHVELQKHKVSVSESQKQLARQLVSKNQAIEMLKKDKKELNEVIRKLNHNKLPQFHYPKTKLERRDFKQQVDVGVGVYQVVMPNEQNKITYVDRNAQLDKKEDDVVAKPIDVVVTPKTSTASMSVQFKAAIGVPPNNSSVAAEAVRPVVPNGFAPEIIVNDEKHKSGDYLVKPEETLSLELRKNEVDQKGVEENNPPNRYKSKFKNDEQNVNLESPDALNFGEENHVFENINKNHLEENKINDNNNNNDLNDVNVNLDQGDPGLQSEDDDDYDDFDKANFHNQVEN